MAENLDGCCEGAMVQRKDWVDYSKGIGIILVVYGHLLSSAFHAGLAVPARFFMLSDSIVYSFHMPLFFFLAGLFAEQSLRKRGVQGFLAGKLRRFAYPYLVWSILQIGVELLFPEHAYRDGGLDDLVAIVYQPWAQFWFLYALMWVYAAYSLLRFSTVILMLVACALFVFPINTEIAALHGFSVEFLFFVAGVVLQRPIMNAGKQAIPLWGTMALGCVFAASGYYVFTHLIPPMRLIDDIHPLYFLSLAALGIAFCVRLSQYLAAIGVCHWLRLFGTCSLQIYLVHMLAGAGARIVLMHLLHVRAVIPVVAISVLAGLLVPIAIYRLSVQARFPYLFEINSAQSF